MPDKVAGLPLVSHPLFFNNQARKYIRPKSLKFFHLLSKHPVNRGWRHKGVEVRLGLHSHAPLHIQILEPGRISCDLSLLRFLAASLVHETNLRWVAEVLQSHLHSPPHHMPEEHGLILILTTGSKTNLVSECSAEPCGFRYIVLT